MSERVVVTLHLPMEMGAASRIMRAVAREYPDATVAEPSRQTSVVHIRADDDPALTKADRQRIARERRRA